MTVGVQAVRQTRIKALDGLRGIAVLLVIAGHSMRAAQIDMPPALAFLEQGGRGVTIFFVLSGFLITSILVNEFDRSGRISLKAFYVRRAFRILPAFYAFLIVIGVLSLAGTFVQVTLPQLLAAGLFVWNYAPVDGTWWLGHTWSLAIEEQFYLLWPLVLVLFKPRIAIRIAVAVILASPLIRLAQYFLFPETREQISVMFHTRADALMVGCLLALLIGHARWDRIMPAIARWWPAYVIFLVAIAPPAKAYLQGVWDLTVGWSIEQLCVAGIICAAIALPNSLITRGLSWKPLTWIGLISYALYLWQQLFLGFGWPSWWSPIIGIVASVAVATASYWLVEKPFLRLKKRWERGVADVQPGI
ncbi:acyltransferase family protein [Microbacterium sp. UBA837]|uniref:acyltransferase family protein n=1 Tax=Microbacterium sp. UBA837 TaxID=1946956 RepID=UPI0025F45998|nr:acyltransferase [Microbacterium sp. UBA837]